MMALHGPIVTSKGVREVSTDALGKLTESGLAYFGSYAGVEDFRVCEQPQRGAWAGDGQDVLGIVE